MAKADVPQFDDLILSRVRLGIVSALMAGDELEFTFLRNALKLSDGNLSVQIRKLEQAGYIKVKKVFVERKPKTFCKITPKGRKAMLALLRHLENLIR
ncbi:MAG: winged helix-turn-helix domain-containing protein [Planctomycetota bacterium]|jgi:DNA-binding MarR family transcriptional regulator